MEKGIIDSRYTRQALFYKIGTDGQKKIQKASAVVIGCGALGSVIANNLCRSGVGRIRIVDRDFVELDNLQRQILFDESDAQNRIPKSIAAVEKLKKVNSSIELEAVVTDVTPRNVENIIKGFQVVLDGTDNLETRFLLNDASIKLGIPWIYGAAVGSYGMTMTIMPYQSPCFRCFIRNIPPPGTLATCDHAGVLNSIPSIVASLQTTAALKIFVGSRDLSVGQIIWIDVWGNEFHNIMLSKDNNCITCAKFDFEFLEGKAISWATVLCGRNMVQITPAEEKEIDLESLRKNLSQVGEVFYNGFMLITKLENYELIIFPTGRAMIKGITDVSVARTLYARYIGT
uniref:THIF-type NAD/FAD binding fold domain-containing protein n=1 Tax=candidate division CPR3 bacterium TaxID=2268181 RepID=A0A7V3J9P2_UNCC3